MAIVKIPDCGRGVNLDLMPEELADGAWSNCQNMRFRNGFAQRFRGMTDVMTTPPVTPYFLVAYQTPTKRFWVHAGAAAVYADDGTTQTDITGTTPTGTQDDRWSGGTLGGVLVLNNSIDQPMYWTGDTAANLATLTGWNSAWRAAVVRPHKGYLVALDVTKSGARYPHMVKWSHVAAAGTIPSSWDETDVTKDAGEQDLADTPDLLVDCLPMGDSLIIYKQRSMYSMTFIGQPYIWRFQRLPSESGMLTRGCAVDTPAGHVVLTAGDVIIHQGGNPKSIADGAVRSFIFNNLDTTNYRRAFLCSNPQRCEVLVCFPMNGSTYCDKAAVWNWQDNTWGLRDLPNVTYGATGQADLQTLSTTWATDSETWDADGSEWNENEYAPSEARLLFCRAAPAITAFDTGTTDNGTAIRGQLQRDQLTFGDAYAVKLVKGVRPKIDAANGTVVQVEVGASMSPDAAPIWKNATSFTVGQSVKSDCFVKGRYISIRLTTTGNQAWKLRSIDFDVQTAGAY